MIENKLREYKSNLSRLKLIECEIKRIENDIELMDPSYISGTAYSQTPKSITNKFNSIVENTVVEIEKNKADMDKLKAELWQLKKDRVILMIKGEYVEALLEGLTEEERFVVEKFYFDGLAWHVVAEKYRKEYGVYKTFKTMKAKRNEALQKMKRNVPIMCR